MKNKTITVKIVFSKSLLEEENLHGECFSTNDNSFTLVINPEKNKSRKKVIATLYHEFTHFVLAKYFPFNESKVTERVIKKLARAEDVEVGLKQREQVLLDSLNERICMKVEKGVMATLKKYWKKIV